MQPTTYNLLPTICYLLLTIPLRTIVTIQASGSVERHSKGRNGNNPGGKQVKAGLLADAKAKKLKASTSLLDKPDDQLGLYEFINCLVRPAHVT